MDTLLTDRLNKERDGKWAVYFTSPKKFYNDVILFVGLPTSIEVKSSEQTFQHLIVINKNVIL